MKLLNSAMSLLIFFLLDFPISEKGVFFGFEIWVYDIEKYASGS